MDKENVLHFAFYLCRYFRTILFVMQNRLCIFLFYGRLLTFLTALAFVFTSSLLYADSPPAVASSGIEIDYGFGWARPERIFGEPARWITEMEADLFFMVAAPEELTFALHGAPYYLNWKQQQISVYLNGHHLCDWSFPMNPSFNAYSCLLPERFIKPGKNRLILRVGYRIQQGKDPRTLGAAVRKIQLIRAGK